MKNSLKSLQEVISNLGPTLVAYSGGVDSTLLAKIARDTLGENVKAVIVSSPTLPDRELQEARDIAALIGIELIEMESDEVNLPEYSANSDQRCYVCKNHRYQMLRKYAAGNGFQSILDGSNADDLGDFRPGQRAVREHGIRSPLQEAGLTKAVIRKLAKEVKLPNWNKPSSACLASRIPYGTPITLDALAKIELAEDFLFQLGFPQLRVRHHDDVARIEIPPAEFQKLLEHRMLINQKLKEIGYAYITLDILGFRSGSMNEGMTIHGST
jgi:uncharacterized protein